MVVLEVAAKDAARVRLVEHDHVVQALTLERADDALAIPVLPRAAHRGHDLLDAELVERSHDGIAIDLVVVAQQESRRLIEHERLPQLQRRPLGRWVRRDVDVHDAPPIQRQHHEDVQRAERHGGHGQEVDGCRLVQVIPQERLPVLRRPPAPLEHVAGDGGLVQEVPECSATAHPVAKATSSLTHPLS